MLRKVLIGAFALIMLGGFAVGAVLIAREAILGPQTAQATGGQGRGATGVEEYQEDRQGRGRVEEAAANTQGRGAGAGRSENTLPSDAGQGRGRVEEASANVQGHGAGEDCSENTLPSDAGQGRGRVEEASANAQGRGAGAGRSENTLPSDAGQGRGEEVTANAQGRGAGMGRSENALPSDGGQGRGQESGGSGAGRSESGSRDGQGAGNTPVERNPAWEELRGTVVEYDHEMTVATADGEVLVGMGQSSYVETQDFQASKGDEVLVYGFHEDDEFKAGRVENLTQGKTLILRDQDGRPMWAGRGEGKNRL